MKKRRSTMGVSLREADRVEVVTLQDNYIDLAAFDGTATVQRAAPVKGMAIRNSILAEHGFSTLVIVTAGGERHSLLFDFGFSEHGAAFNADALGIDLREAEGLVLSHGHMDHFGGLIPLARRVGKDQIDLVLHPTAFRRERYLKVGADLKLDLPSLSAAKLHEAGIFPVETKKPSSLLDGHLAFLGEIPRVTEFETGFPLMFYRDKGEEKWDPIEDDTAIVACLKGKGLVVLTGCAHSGIINTAKYAREVTGIEPIHVVMGGFHLTGAVFEPRIAQTVEALKALKPRYVVPTHCTGRKAILQIEKEMPQEFLLNMSGTRMVFEA
ncbi:MAG: MBL fold metallo-hydrolase [bacterium]